MQFSSIGNLPDPKTLEHKLYAVVKRGIVKGYAWKTDVSDRDHQYVLMTFDNSPAWIDGEYKEGKFYEPKE